MLATVTTSTVILAQFVFNDPVYISEKAVICLLAVAGVAVSLTVLCLWIKSRR